MLRERGERAEAARLEAEQLPDLLASLHAAGESEDEIQRRLISLFAIEEERVADAAVLAELLLPALRGESSAPANSVAVAPVRADSAATIAATATTNRPPTAAAPPPPPAPRKRSTDIATFIDEMLEQESAPARRAS